MGGVSAVTGDAQTEEIDMTANHNRLLSGTTMLIAAVWLRAEYGGAWSIVGLAVIGLMIVVASFSPDTVE